MLNGTPLRDIDNICAFQGVVQIGDLRRPLPNRYAVVTTDLFEVPLQDYSSHCARRPIELILGKFFSCV